MGIIITLLIGEIMYDGPLVKHHSRGRLESDDCAPPDADAAR